MLRVKTVAARTIIAAMILCGLVLGGFVSFGSIRPTEEPTAGSPSKLAEEKKDKEEKGREPSQPTRPAEPGVQALAAASTDIVVVEVLETRPRRAIEGARDTVQLKVIRTLSGRLASGETFGVYYHLLWTDERSEVLEPPKFQKGQRYLLFLRAHLEDRGDSEGKRWVYELTDQWLAVQPNHVELVKETVVALRAVLSPLQGTWKLRSAERGGKAAKLKGPPSKVVIKGDTMTTSFESDQSKTYLIEMSVVADTRSIDLYTTTLIGIGREGGREVRQEFRGKYLDSIGICAVEGNTLKLCLVPWTSRERRPTSFTTEGMPECELFILTRQE